MTTGYVALYTIGGDGLGIASAATDVSLANRNLALGTGSLTATNLTGTLQTAAQTNVTSLGTLSALAIAGAPNGTNLLDVQSYPASAGVVSQTSAIRVYQGSYNHPGGGTISSMYGVYISAGAGGETGDIFLGANLYVQTPLFGDRRISAAFEGNVVITSPSVSSAPTLATDLQIHSATQNSSRLTFSGQEFYQAANTSTEGPAFVLGVNRSGNRQLWLIDSADASIASTTNYALRFHVGNAAIDAISTNGVTAKTLTLGNSGSGVYFPGNIGVGVAVSSTVAVNFANAMTTATAGADLYGLLNQRTYTYSTGSTNSFATGAYFSCNTAVATGASLSAASTLNVAPPVNSGVGTVAAARTLVVSAPTIGTTANIATYTANLVVGATYYSTTPPASGAIIEGNLTLYSGVLLPTSGGTATLLNYYEELSQTFTFAGVWAANQSVTGKLVRVGKTVTLIIPFVLVAATASAGVAQTAGTAVPVRFRPNVHTSFIVRVYNSGAFIYGLLVVQNDGICALYSSANGGSFTSGGTAGWDQMSVSWNLL